MSNADQAVEPPRQSLASQEEQGVPPSSSAGQRTNDGQLAVRAPFHFEATVRVLQRRASNRVDVWVGERYVRLLRLTNGLALVRIANLGSIDDPHLEYSILAGPHSLTAHAAVRRAFTRILALDIDPAPLQQLASIDSILLPTVESLRGMRPPRFADLFEAFASVIPFQQLSLDAGISILGKFVERFGEHVAYQGHRYFAFPTARAIVEAPVEDLSACGLSAKKAQTLREIAKAIDDGVLTEHSLAMLDSRAAIARLVELPGVGPWTAGLVLLRGLGRTDVFPSGDAGAARALRQLLKLHKSASIDEVTERFGADRGYLYFCCLGSRLLERGAIRAARS